VGFVAAVLQDEVGQVNALKGLAIIAAGVPYYWWWTRRRANAAAA
jgi:hypothetical protein